MKVVVIGANGQLGSDLCRVLDGYDILSLTHDDIEVTDIASVSKALAGSQADVIINTAAYVRVDECESNQDRAYAVNALGARNVAVLAEKLGASLVHISTDSVFGGENRASKVPYTEFDVPVPLNTYGRSKLAGEQLVRHLCHRHFIVRSCGLFGYVGSSGKGGNFVETIISLARQHQELRVMSDQVVSPTYTKDLAAKIAQIIGTEYYGIFHIANRGACSWYEFAVEILRLAGMKTPVIPITSDQYPQRARRASFSALDNYHLRLLDMDDMKSWQEALAEYMGEKGHIKGWVNAHR